MKPGLITKIVVLALWLCGGSLNLGVGATDEQLRSTIETLVLRRSSVGYKEIKKIGNSAVPILIQMVKDCQCPTSMRDVKLFTGATMYLGVLKDRAASDVLISVVKSKPEWGRTAEERRYHWAATHSFKEIAVWALGEIGEYEAVDVLIGLLHERSHIRGAAAEALGKIGDSRAIPALSELLEVEKSKRVRQKATEALGKLMILAT